MEKIGSIQVLRACAVTLVVACHSFSRFAVGGFGVDIFFVVSGFIIATISPGQSPGEFLSRRFWRIYPVYWLLMLPLLFTAPIEWSRFAASLTLWPVWGGSLQSPYLPVAWTLYCEVLFYGATALAMVNWRAPLIIFGLAMFIDGITANPVAAHLGNPMVFEFLAGVALTRVARQPLSAALGLIVAAGLLGFAPSDNIIGLEVLSGSGGFERLFWWGMPAALIAYAALTFDAVLSRARWAVKLGDASYAIYLVFAPITSWLATFDERVAFVTALAVGIATHYFIERPILSMRPRLRLPEVQR
jgi:exopolysaccharide production protein ExoZ